MNTRRFFHSDLSANSITLDKDEATHAKRVLRIQPGQTVELFDGAGTTANGIVSSLAPQLTITIDQRHHTPPPSPKIHIASAIPKGDRAATLIQMLTELGAHQFTPLETQRSVVDPGPKKLQRLQRIATESAKQSHRSYFMNINPTLKFPKLIQSQDYDLKLIAHPSDPPPVPSLQNLHDHSNILILIGPEGGWTNDELQSSTAADFQPWSFNPNILRIETAAAAAVAIIYAHLYPSQST